jgi:hypothetical protein
MTAKVFKLVIIITVCCYLLASLLMLFDLYKADQLNDTHIAAFNSKKELLYDILNQSNDTILKQEYIQFLRGVKSSFIKHTYSLRVQIELFFLFLILLLFLLIKNRIDLINKNILKVVKIILVSWYVLFSLVVIFNLIYNNDCMSRIIYLEHTAISKSNNEILKKEYDYFLLDMRDNYTVYSRSLEKQVLVFYLFFVLLILILAQKYILILFYKIRNYYINFNN